jgi:MBG domain-containing protein
VRVHFVLRLAAALQAFLLISTLVLPGLVSADEPTPTDSPAPTEQPSDPPSSDPTSEPTAPPSAPDPTPDPTPAPPAETPEPVAAPTISSDKADYAPGELVTLTGANWAAGESVHIYVNDELGSTWSRNVDVTADSSGSLLDQFNLPNWFVSNYAVVATASTSGMAVTSFTDSNPQTIAVAAPTSVAVIQGATAVFGNVTVTVGGNTNPCTVTLGVNPALPAGAAAVFGSSPATTTGGNIVSTLSVTTTGATPAGTYTFQVTGTNSAGCQGPGPTAGNTLTLTVNSAMVNTTTAASTASAAYGDTSVIVNAIVTPGSGPAINSGSVTFTVKHGVTTIGAATTDNTVVAGAASVTYALPAGTAAGAYTIEAAYSGATGLSPSSNATQPPPALTINPGSLTVTADDQSKTYGETFTFDGTEFTADGLVNGDSVDSATLASDGAAGTAGVAGSPYEITISDAVGSGLGNYAISYVSGSFTVGRAHLTVTADDKIKVLNAANPTLTYVISGFKNLETAGVVSGAASCSTTALINSPVGPYPITCTIGSLAAANYDFPPGNFVPGTLTILYAPSTASCLGSPGHAILQPIDSAGASVFKQGSTVPAKFRVCDASGNSIGTPGVVTSFKLIQKYTGTSSATVNEDPVSTTPDTAFRWSSTDQQWIFNLNTKSLTKSWTYIYEIKLNDGTSIIFSFGLK